MCQDCGCNDHDHHHENKEKKAENKIVIDKSISEANDAIAHEISHNLKDKGILCINLMGSPGSGKTTVVEGIAKHISPAEIAVIQGDLESDIDKKRLEKSNIQTHQINTHSGCHLNSSMINKALLEIDLKEKKYLIIENVGNLVCPADIKIGQHLNIVVSSTTEGSDKPKKYPIIFMNSSLAIISKSDLAEHVDFDEEQYLTDIKNINGKIKIIRTSKKDSDSFKEISYFLEHQRDHLLEKHHHH